MFWIPNGIESESEVAQSCPTLCDPVDYSPSGSSFHGILQARILEWVAITGVGCHFLLQRIFPTQGSNPGLPHCRQTLYHLSHHGSPKNTGVDIHSLLQGILLTQGLNPGLPHCKQILHHLSHQRSPKKIYRSTSLVIRKLQV